MAAQRQKQVKADAPLDDADVEVDEDAYQQIEKLAEAGVNAGDIKKARDAGYYTIQVCWRARACVRVCVCVSAECVYARRSWRWEGRETRAGRGVGLERG